MFGFYSQCVRSQPEAGRKEEKRIASKENTAIGKKQYDVALNAPKLQFKGCRQQEYIHALRNCVGTQEHNL